jgi:hypothetical protein
MHRKLYLLILGLLLARYSLLPGTGSAGYPPELSHEKEIENLKEAVRELEIEYVVAQDNHESHVVLMILGIGNIIPD